MWPEQWSPSCCTPHSSQECNALGGLLHFILLVLTKAWQETRDNKPPHDRDARLLWCFKGAGSIDVQKCHLQCSCKHTDSLVCTLAPSHIPMFAPLTCCHHTAGQPPSRQRPVAKCNTRCMGAWWHALRTAIMHQCMLWLTCVEQCTSLTSKFLCFATLC